MEDEAIFEVQLQLSLLQPFPLLPSLPSALHFKLTIPNQRPHESHTRPLTQRQPSRLPAIVVMSLDGLSLLLGRFRLSRQSTLVHFQSDGRDESNVGWNSISYGEGDEISWDEGVGEEGERLGVAAGGEINRG